MDSKLFNPSIDWAHALPDSLVWIALAWTISAVGVLAVAAVLRVSTRWGRQFWEISGPYFTGRDSVRVWVMLGVLLLSVITAVRLNVLFSFQGNDLYSSLQTAFQGAAGGDDAVRASGVHGFWMSIAIFSVMAVLHVARVMLDIYLTQHFMVNWRIWLTERLTGDWLDGRAYYRSRFVTTPLDPAVGEAIEGAIDNPDQRIQQDIDIFTAGNGASVNAPANSTGSTLLFGAVQSMVTVVSFTAILWNLSGTLTVFGFDIPRAMFLIVLVYVTVATIVAFWIGRPLIRLSFRNELTNAAFRYALVRVRDAAESVAFYRGELAERVQLRTRFRAIVANYLAFVNRTIGFAGWNLSVSQAIVPLPWVIQAPRLFDGQIMFGGVAQTASAFGSISDSLSFFRNAYDNFAGYRASIIRLHGLLEANREARELPELLVKPSPDDSVALEGVEVRSPDGVPLIEALDVQLSAGDALMIAGPSGSGKTTLLRSLAQLWPYASGTLRRPDAANATMFISQLPYIPLGDLRTVVSYPLAVGEVSDAAIDEALNKVALPNLVERLDEVDDWAKVLSPGEQQRVAFARILLTRPKAVFLDESTSALDEGLELTLYRLLRTELPDTILVSVSHRHTVRQHHRHVLELLGQGRWDLSPV
ncbi:multidrug ABC transporter ATP-binding protein [Mycolicibacter minnesotensis]|uniref:Multidrug ABC transporter ATP-binding protein n=1 Tax=Mycolicibacter minnesotensis TaxID=1118379 RepID=A0A7I7RA18_9MYCO|nr:ABC transporter ATP-binding protein/permease [Mycolicibacter minnesotensis]ORB03096.1 multidrug ABC transporter ATP-binding protein [Mycolicibacter minnesotensis]BBY35498.1 vitamin B12 transport ATP-binding protein BacA [Mycolicibacter minnesotensis]